MRRSNLVAVASAAAFAFLASAGVASAANTPVSSPAAEQVQGLTDAIVTAAKAAETTARERGLSDAEVQAEVEAAVLAVIAQSGADASTVTAALNAARTSGGLTAVADRAIYSAQVVVASADTAAPAATGNGNGASNGRGSGGKSGGAPYGPPAGGGGGGGSGYRPNGN